MENEQSCVVEENYIFIKRFQEIIQWYQVSKVLSNSDRGKFLKMVTAEVERSSNDTYAGLK